MSTTPSATEKKLLHYLGKAIADFNLIQRGDRIMVCLSGGKDSFTLLTILNILRRRTNNQFEVFAFTLDQAQPGWDDTVLHAWLAERHIPYEILTRDTYSIVKEKIPEGQTYCALCSRLRRGIIYRYAEEHGFNKIALGHHRDDLIRTLMMSIFYNGDIRSMPPKLLSDNKKHIVIRPMCYIQEADIIQYAKEQDFPIIPCTLCGSQENLARKRITRLIDQLTEENPKIPSNMLHALQSIKPSQLMDQDLWPFRKLELEVIKPIAQTENKPVALASYNLQTLLTHDKVLRILQEGNQRFLEETNAHRSFKIDTRHIATNQHPIAVILGCIDSRVPVETVFDMSFGDLFCVRVAGNVVNDDVLASIEYACHIIGAPLIVVLGHTRCGAIAAACDGVVQGHITQLLAKIKPAITAETETLTERTSQNSAFVGNVTHLNIANTLQHIYEGSDILRKMADQKKIAMVGAIYDVNTGAVQFKPFAEEISQLCTQNNRPSAEKLQQILLDNKLETSHFNKTH